jgi:hypothetical protein
MTASPPAHLLCVAVFLVASKLSGQTEARFSESFQSPAGALPKGWHQVNGPQASGEALIEEIPKADGQAGLVIRRPEGPLPGNSAVYYLDAIGGGGDGRLRDFSGSVLIRYSQVPKAASSTRGVVLRAQSPDYANFRGYYLAIEPRGDHKGLGIYYNPPRHTDSGEPLAFTPLPSDLKLERDYLLKFSAKGPSIEGSLWTVDEAGAPLKEVVSVTTGEASEESGYFGFRGGYGNSGPVNTWYRSLNLEVE